MSAYPTQTDPTAVQGRRIGAWIVDVIIIAAIGLLASLAFTSGETVLGNECERRGVSDPIFDSDDLDSNDGTDSEICFDDGDFIVFSETESSVINLGNTLWPNLISLAYVIGVFWIWQGLTGLTPGKAIFGLRTVNEQGEAPGILKAFLRWILWIVDAFPYCCVVPLVGGITMLASKGHRRVGDMAAKTYVVGKGSMGAGPIIVPGKDQPPAYVPPAAPPPSGFGAPPPGGFGAPPPPGAVSAPTAPGPVTDDPAPPTGPGGEAQWDPQRNAYIQWDAAQDAWLQFDDRTQTWKPIDS
jgi:uncharacterized RDD family membrane protein YckC